MLIPIKVTQPSYSRPVVTVGLIIANVLVFVYQLSLDASSQQNFMTAYGLQPHYFRIGNIFTAMFIHANWINIAGNVLFLWVFGNTVEDILGHVKFLLFYLFCGVTAALAQTVVHPSSTTPMVGAGGAIAGVMGAYLLKFPRSRVDMVLFALLIFRFELPAWSMLAYWFATQLYGGLGGIREASQSGTAFFAHVGGFVQGIVMVHWMGARERVSRRRDLYW